MTRFSLYLPSGDAKEQKDINLAVGKLFEGESAERVPADKRHFFSLLPSIQDYRRLVERLGPEEAQGALLAMHDLVAVQLKSKRPSWVSKAVNSDAFRLSLTRSSESFFAFNNGVDVLRGVEHLRRTSSIVHIALQFQLEGFAAPHRFLFNFVPKKNLGKRIAVVIGQNGVGKSRALGTLVTAALNGDHKTLCAPSGGRLELSRIIAIGTPGETELTFPRERQGNRWVNYRRLAGGRKSLGQGFGPFAEKLSRSNESIRGKSRWLIFTEAISSVIPIGEIALPCSQEFGLPEYRRAKLGGYVSLLDLAQMGEASKLLVWGAIDARRDPLRIRGNNTYPLSSGEVSFLRFAVQACLFVEDSALVLLDEPETHLHPNLVTAFVRLLDKILDSTGSVAIIATHSAYLVREVPRSQVHVLKIENGQPIASQPRLRTFGADVGAISAFVFDGELTANFLEELANNVPSRKKAREEFFESLSDDLSLEAVMYLKSKA